MDVWQGTLSHWGPVQVRYDSDKMSCGSFFRCNRFPTNLKRSEFSGPFTVFLIHNFFDMGRDFEKELPKNGIYYISGANGTNPRFVSIWDGRIGDTSTR
jgi:hypothetical protein